MTTILDIANTLGVAPSTVSRALSGSHGIKASTRKAVLDTAEQLGYERNVAAASLRRGKSNTVGIIVPRINRGFFSSAIGGAEAVLNEAGYYTIICQTQENFESEVKALKAMKSNRVAGVLISHATASQNGEHIRKHITQGTILVQFDRVFKDLPGTKIVNDNFQGAYEATRHLVEMGYERIGHIGGFIFTEAYRERLNGYRQALIDMGRPVNEDFIFYEAIMRESGYEKGKLAIARGCDALYCAGDYAALGAIDAAKEKRLRIPDEFGVVGTADESFTDLMVPSMSSVAQYPFEIGRRAARAFLVSQEREACGNGEIVVPMSLKIRESSSRKSL